MMKKYTLLTALTMIVSLVFAQENTLRYDTDLFTGVKFSSAYDVELIQSDSSYIIAEGEELEMDDLVIQVSDEVLNIKVKKVRDDLKFTIHSPQYTYIETSGSVDVSAKAGLKGEELNIKSSGASDFDAKLDYNKVSLQFSGSSDCDIIGRVDSLYIKASGASDVTAVDVENAYASIIASGASDISVNPKEVLLADLSGASSLQYKSEPPVKKVNESGAVWHGPQGGKKSDTLRLKSEDGEVIIIGDYDLEDLADLEDLEDLKDLEDLESQLGDVVKKYKKRKKFKGNWAGLELGINGYLTPDNSLDLPSEAEFLELDYPHSFNVSLNPFQQSVNLIGQQFGLVTGLGIRWNQYRFDKDMILSTDSILTGINENDSKIDYIKSKLTSVYLTVPLLLEFQTNHNHDINSFHISAGVIGGLRMMTHTKRVFKTEGGSKNKPKEYDNFHLNPFTLDATARIGWGSLNLYATYSLIEMFRDNKGPELYPFSVGFVLPF